MTKQKLTVISVGIFALLCLGLFLPDITTEIQDKRQINVQQELPASIYAAAANSSTEQLFHMMAHVSDAVPVQTIPKHARHTEITAARVAGEQLLLLEKHIGSFSADTYPLKSCRCLSIIYENTEKVCWKVQFSLDQGTISVILDDESEKILSLHGDHIVARNNATKVAEGYLHYISWRLPSYSIEETETSVRINTTLDDSESIDIICSADAIYIN